MKDKKKKILKIIQIVYDILSAVFIVFVCVAMAIAPRGDYSHSEVKENVTTQIEMKTRNNLILNNANIYTFFDIDEKFLNRVFTDYVFSSFAYSVPFTTGSFNAQFLLGNSNLVRYCVNNYYFNSFDPFNSTFAGYVVDGNIYTIGLQGYDEGHSRVRQFRFALHGKNNPNDNNETPRVIVSFDFYAICPIDNNGNYLGEQLSFTFKEFVDGNQYFILVAPNEATTFNSYFEGASTYKAGYDAGYGNGYNKGYVDGSSGVTNNAFALIGSAFQSVGSILSIEVLPSLPLWLLVFTPLVIAVVIVVVKMIKG